MSATALKDIDERNLDSAIEKLKLKTKRTSGARFIAADRLRAKSHSSLICVSILSLFTLASGSINFFFLDQLTATEQNILLFSSVIAASLILFLNAFVASRDFELQSEQLRLCAIRLDKLKNELSIAEIREFDTYDNKLAMVRAHWDKYNSVIVEHPFNHDDIDFDYYQQTKEPQPAVDNLKDQKKLDNVKRWTFLRMQYHKYAIYFWVVAVPLIIFLNVLSNAATL